MIPLGTYVQQGQSTVRRWILDPRVHGAVRIGVHILAGFCFGAASLANAPLPLAMAFTCACTGWSAVFAGVGSAAGYWVFWGENGYLPMVWLVPALLLALVLGDRQLTRNTPLMLPVTASLLVAATGVLFQAITGEGASVQVYLLQVALAGLSNWLFTRVLQGRNPILDWLACSLAVLALAQIRPVPYFGFGFIAAGILGAMGSFPAAVLAGLALDLAQVTPVPMAAVLAMGYLVRFLPRYPKTLARMATGAVYILVMYLCGRWDLQPLPGLLLGGLVSAVLPGPARTNHRRGETGMAQVRLEMASGVLQQTRQLLLEVVMTPVDEGALVEKAAQRACGECSYRNNCKDARRISQLPEAILHKPLLTVEELPIVCRKSGRFLAELHRSQEQLRSIRADRERQREYRAAVVQQYGFLSEFLQDLSDQLARRNNVIRDSYIPQVVVYGNRPEMENGDRCMKFPGTGGRYYVLLCDGMGTGLGAIQEGKTAATLLRRLLSAGYPASHALRSINSLCALRERAGAVTVDLLEIELDSGKAMLYKWGAAPSYLVTQNGAEQIGSPTPPPGISVTDIRETAHRLTLRREQLLMLVSDGVIQEEAMRCCKEGLHQPPGELAARILSFSQLGCQDDATVITVQLTVKE